MPRKKKMRIERITRKLASKRDLSKNELSVRTYDLYKRTTEIIEIAEIASGRRAVVKSDTGSTLAFEINKHGAYSTTSQSF
jgi:hypothetical protein